MKMFLEFQQPRWTIS